MGNNSNTSRGCVSTKWRRKRRKPWRVTAGKWFVVSDSSSSSSAPRERRRRRRRRRRRTGDTDTQEATEGEAVEGRVLQQGERWQIPQKVTSLCWTVLNDSDNNPPSVSWVKVPKFGPSPFSSSHGWGSKPSRRMLGGSGGDLRVTHLNHCNCRAPSHPCSLCVHCMICGRLRRWSSVIPLSAAPVSRNRLLWPWQLLSGGRRHNCTCKHWRAD